MKKNLKNHSTTTRLPWTTGSRGWTRQWPTIYVNSKAVKTIPKWQSNFYSSGHFYGNQSPFSSSLFLISKINFSFFLFGFSSSSIIRDLTLRSAASFGSFHLIRLLYDEYMYYIIEHKIANEFRLTPLAVMSCEDLRSFTSLNTNSWFYNWNFLVYLIELNYMSS